MMIKLGAYDLEAARRLYIRRVSRERGLVFDSQGRIDDIDTQSVRKLTDSSAFNSAVHRTEWIVVNSLSVLPVENGGTAIPVEGGYAASLDRLRPELPLVQALMILRGHPCHGGFGELRLQRAEEPPPWDSTVRDPAPILEKFYTADPQPWDLSRLEATILEGARHFMGDVEVDPTWTPDVIYPGSRVSEYLGILGRTFLFDAFGAFDPGFTRADALVGEWWLLQPVSPRLHHHHLALKFGLRLHGFLPPSHVDAEGRVLMACFPTQEMSDEHRIGLIEDSKWIAGWQKVTWSKDRPPLADPGFDLVLLDGVTEDSYGPYRHSSDLPRWPA